MTGPATDGHAVFSFRGLRALIVLGIVLGLPALSASRGTASEHAPPGEQAAFEEQVSETAEPTAPRGAIRSYIDAARAGDYVAAAGHLDLRRIPAAERSTTGPRLARQLKIVLDRKLWVQYELLSADPRGDLDDGFPPNLDSIGIIDDIGVFIERVPEGDGHVWEFSSGTVARIPELYEKYGYGRLGEVLPAILFEIRFLEAELWQWVGLLALIAVAFLVAWLAAGLLAALARLVVARTETVHDDRILKLLIGPMRLIIAIIVVALGSVSLALSVKAYEILGTIEKGLLVIAVTWLVLRLVDFAGELLGNHLENTDRAAAVAVLPVARNVTKAFLIGIAVIALLDQIGISVSGLVAGLGVGGIAVALAAQKTIANLFGGLSLVTDQPVRVGDFCRYAEGKLGVVEQIGLRSTRVRTLDRTLVSVPNSDFSEFQLENFAVRDRIRLITNLGLRYETSPDQLRFVLAELRKLLAAHPRVLPDPARVRFVGFGAYSLDLEVFAYVDTGDWNDFLEVREDLFLRFMDIVKDSGTGFAFPSQTLYLGRDGGLEHEKTRQAEERVGEWREGGKLPFPDFDPRTVEQLSNTLDYPPRGSASGS